MVNLYPYVFIAIMFTYFEKGDLTLSDAIVVAASFFLMLVIAEVGTKIAKILEKKL